MSVERDRHDSKSSNHHDYLVKLRGIPYSSNKDDIKQFLHPCRVVTVHLFASNGSSPGECLVDLDSENDIKTALKKTNQCLDKKTIEVLRATSYEYNFYVKHKGMVSWREAVIRMSGLPFACTMADVQNFFENIEIARNGIYITRDMADKALGDGFVAFVNMDNAYKAIDMHDQKRIQHRYIELFPSTYDEAKRRILNDARTNAKQFVGDNETEENKTNDVIVNNNNNNNNNDRNHRSRSQERSRSSSRERRQREIKRRHSPSKSPPPRSRPPPKATNQRSYNNNRRRTRSRSPVRRSSPVSSRSGEFLVKMRGMPFTVVEEDIRKFFPSSCQPMRIEIQQDRRMNRANGDAHIYFTTLDEATEAMKCDRKYMGSRYIELYFDSPRHSSSNSNRKRKSDDSPHCSPSKSRNHRHSRSRSDSDS